MVHIILTAAWLAAAPEPEAPREVERGTKEEKPPLGRKEDLEARIAELEREVRSLRLKASEEQPIESAPTQSAGSTSPNVFNPTLTVIGNGFYRYDDRAVLAGDTRIDKTFNLREIELDLRAAVDPFADGVLIAAFPSEKPGTFSAEIEEGYINIKRLPVPLLDHPPL